MHRWLDISLLASGVCLLLVGCGGNRFAEVQGTVKLDGKPLAHATVEFQPAGGSPAIGVTDENGHYRLESTANQGGAPLGAHQVRITSFRESKPNEKERIPAKYNKSTELTREVKPGAQTFIFELKTD